MMEHKIAYEYLEHAIDGYHQLVLKIVVVDHNNITIVMPFLCTHDNVMLPKHLQEEHGVRLLTKVIEDQRELRNIL